MAGTIWLLVLSTALSSARAQHRECPAPGSGLLQSSSRAFLVDPEVIEEARPEGDSPAGVDPAAHSRGEGETLEEKEAALATLARVEGNGAEVEQAEQVLSELSHGDRVEEKDLVALEGAVANHQSQETLEANGALMTEDDYAKLHGTRVEETGAAGTVGGDMLPAGPEQLVLLRKNDTVHWVGAGRPWTNGRVPYCFAPDVAQSTRNIFKAAASVVHRNLRCIRFEEVGYVKGTSLSKERWEEGFDPEQEAACSEQPAVFVQSNPGYGCFAGLGMIPSWKSQALQIGPGCEHVGITLHEILHALGVQHEHQRFDRDAVVDIHYGNVKPDSVLWFNKDNDVYTGQPYDLLSIMHYGAYSFSVNDRPTITAKEGGHANLGGRGSLTESDVEQLKAMYKLQNSACETNARTGVGCEDMPDGSCQNVMNCSFAARRDCCVCGGGLQVQCFMDEPCQPHEVLSGPTVPYLGWLSSEGTIGDWWYGTVAGGLRQCSQEPGCRGVTLNLDAATAMSGSHYMLLKTNFVISGDDNSGWTSFKLAPPVPTPAPTPAPAAHMVERPGHFIGGGGDIMGGYKKVRLSEAKSMCLAEPACQGFTWGGPVPRANNPVWVLFKNHKHLGVSGGWNAWVKED
eukprot:CAMPEP_0171067810 /NCGR_PEP_ID=MMETSP0766_2-20121228/8207_1 /TAXON_ID=439317 /ORGANISM="Gambierdiscus australes, Strain CAWD 149" /LENGTH=627 /DNA_ID=CAMNT_0011524075 /DNA_START=42 /DNA_END=1925 /DNA_ORIENTATION=+